MTILFKGVLPLTGEPYQVEPLQLEHLLAILQLQDEVYTAMPVQSFLQTLSKEEYAVMLHGKGCIIGAFVQGQLIAIRALLIPEIDEHHLGRFVGLQDQELQRVIYQEISLVAPHYQGNRLQQQLAKLIMTKLSQEQHSFAYVCATVAPNNMASLKDKFAQQMRIQHIGPIYEDKIRYVFVRELPEAITRVPLAEKLIEMSKTDEQQQLLANGNWTGTRLTKQDDTYYIVFQQFK